MKRQDDHDTDYRVIHYQTPYGQRVWKVPSKRSWIRRGTVYITATTRPPFALQILRKHAGKLRLPFELGRQYFR